MTENLPVPQGKAKALWAIIKASGPFLASQSEKLSEKYARHQLRLAEVEALKEFMVEEARTVAAVRRRLMDKYQAAAPEERLMIRRDLDETTKELRRLGVVQRAVEHISQTEDKEPRAIEFIDIDAEVSPPWIDRFNEWARASNEPWRSELLARSLALEASRPGSTGLRVLWLIGTLDEASFHAFAGILDVASHIDGDYLVPSFDPFLEMPIPTCVLPEKKLSECLFMVDGLSLVGDPYSSASHISAGTIFRAAYGTREIQAKAKSELRINGVVPTPLGDAISRLYEPKPNLLGQQIFEAWLNTVRGSVEILTET